MGSRTFFLFYVLSMVLLILGFLTKDLQVVDTTWGSTVIKGMWSFFAPYAFGALFIAVVYHFCYGISRPVSGGFVTLHLILVVVGLLFSYNIYRMAMVVVPAGVDTVAIETGQVPFYLFLPGPVLLIASFVVFVMGIIRTKRKTS